MGEEKKVVIKEKKKSLVGKYRHMRVFGVSLVVITALLLLCISFLLILRISPELQNLFFDRNIEQESSNSSSTEITITEEENVIINVVKESSESVVSIAVTQLSLEQGEGIVDRVSNIGTGFIVDSNGIIITNQHVVSNTQASYIAITNEGKKYSVTEIIRDDSNDIAILKVDATNLKAIELGDSDNLLAGQTVIAIGTPLGEYAGSVTTGVISGLRRSVTTSSGWFGSTTKVYENVIQTDAAVNPGNSGGPLISTEGKVVGVNFATSSGADNISFALPINIVKQRLSEYITYGKFIKPYIGISYQMISEYEALYYKDVVAGALVITVDPKGPASKAGIERGDIITKINKESVENSFASLIQSFKVGDEIELELWNAGKSRDVKVTLVEAE
ncbi:MAG: trypsin-like peptidase domain-containing protein [Candidatus Dojkabacteria bacterium]|jgi:S1-C subfamily serine protease|nr:trypsin-like peptidase domain-containing protein [Candidatus Dojkabacteria bacterium]